MSAHKDGGPAFPCLAAINAPNEGMSLRDHFAGEALKLIADYAELDKIGAQEIARAAYEIADAMIEEKFK